MVVFSVYTQWVVSLAEVEKGGYEMFTINKTSVCVLCEEIDTGFFPDNTSNRKGQIRDW